MKNAGQYEKLVRKLLGSMPKAKAPQAAPDEELVPILILSVLTAEAPRKLAQKALEAFQTEFVDYNELRVSPAKEIGDRMGKNFPLAREKGETLARVLNAVFDKTSSMTMEYMKDMSKKDLRRHLAEVGLSPYSVAYVMLTGFGAHAVPLDMTLLDVLKMKEVVHPNCEIEDAQGFLERAIGAKDAPAAHEFFRNLIEKETKALAAWRKANPELLTKPPEILPPPKFKMIAKSQPLPPMKGEPGFEGEEELPAVIVETDIEETVEEVPEEGAEVEVEEFEAPADEEGPPHAPPPAPAAGKAKPAKPSPAAKASPGKGEKKPPKKPDRKR
jgi:endonuclease III